MSRKKVDKSELNLALIGDRIAFIRASKSMNQKEFGEVIGLSKGNISCFENHKYSPSFDAMVKISEHFSVNTEWLMFGRGDVFRNSSTRGVSVPECTNSVKDLERQPLVKEIHEILMEIQNEDNECLKEIKGFLRSELKRVREGKIVKTTEQQFRELESRIARIEQKAHWHDQERLRHDDPPELKDKILNRRAI